MNPNHDQKKRASENREPWLHVATIVIVEQLSVYIRVTVIRSRLCRFNEGLPIGADRFPCCTLRSLYVDQNITKSVFDNNSNQYWAILLTMNCTAIVLVGGFLGSIFAPPFS